MYYSAMCLIVNFLIVNKIPIYLFYIVLNIKQLHFLIISFEEVNHKKTMKFLIR